jgi:glycosyltransferase involved in cell wall biosynthesis
MRILFLNPGGSLGGAERCLLDLVASIREHSRHAEVALGLVAGGDGPLVAAAEARGLQIFRLPLSERLASVGDSALVAHGVPALASFARRAAYGAVEAPEYARKLKATIQQFAPSIVHSNGIKMHLLAAAVRERAPLVWHIRDFIGVRPLVSRAMCLLSGRATAAIAISKAVAEDVRRVVPRLPVSVLYDAIDTAVFAPEGRMADLDSLAGSDRAPGEAIRVGFVATYARWKGHDVFLNAAHRLRAVAEQHGVRFYVIGGPIYDTAASQYGEDELRSMVHELGIHDFVRFIPFRENIEDVYRALDIVVHASSRPEPFGRTIAEAMATGKPLVASRDSGAAELFVDGADAIGTPARDPLALAEAIRGLILEPRRREVLGRAARAAAVERFSRDRLANGLFAIYRSTGCMEDTERTSVGQA